MTDNGHRVLELALKDLLSKCTQYTQSQSFLDAFKITTVAPAWSRPYEKKWPSQVHNTSFNTADCDADHSLITCKVVLNARRLHHSKRWLIGSCFTPYRHYLSHITAMFQTKGLLKIKTERTGDHERTNTFISYLRETCCKHGVSTWFPLCLPWGILRFPCGFPYVSLWKPGVSM